MITRVSPEDEELREKIGGRGPQNLGRTPGGVNTSNHMRARAVRQLVGDDAWDRYLKFTIERNPWDMVVSAYAWGASRGGVQSFSEFVADRLPFMRRNAAIYRIRGKVAVDKVCLYESLDADLAEVYSRLGLPGPPDLPRAKSGLRDGRHYREWYGEVERRRVAELFAETIEEFGYEF